MRHTGWFLFVLLLGIPYWAKSQTDTEFWFVAPEVWAAHGDAPIVLRFATLDVPSIITVEQPANPTFPVQTLNLAANSVASLDLTPWMGMVENKPVNSVLDYGLHITATAEVTAYYEVNHQNNPDIFTLKGEAALGTEFYTPFQNFLNNNYLESKSGIDIVSTEDGTEITITPTKALVGHPANVPFTITLDEGETYSLRAASHLAAEHPTGTHIVSSAPIAVTMSDDSIVGAPYGGTCFDLLGDQLIPVHIAGDEYIAVKGPALNGPDKVFILATEDNTEVSVNNVLFTTLNAGEMYTHSLLANVAYYTTSEPVVVLHMTGVSCEVAGAILPPLACTGSQEVPFVRSTNQDFALTIIVQSGAEGGFAFNGNPIWIPSTSFSAVPGTGGTWLYSQITATGFIPTLSASRVTNTLGRFHLGIINGLSTSYARYGYFSDFQTYHHEVSVSADSVCVGELVAIEAEEILGGSYEWTGPSGFTSTAASFEISPVGLEDAGIYVVTGTVDACPILPDTLELIVIEGPSPPVVESPDPWCEGTEAVITALGEGSTWQWTGPSGVLADTVNFIAIDDPGVYSVIAFEGQCASLSTAFDAAPNPTFDLNLPDDEWAVCTGMIWEYADAGSPDGTWNWTGPNGFTSMELFMSIGPASSADAGWYVLNGTVDGCPISPDSVQLVVESPQSIQLEVPVSMCSADSPSLLGSNDINSGTWLSDCSCLIDNELNPVNAPIGTIEVTYLSDGICAETASAEVDIVGTPSAAFGAPLDACLGQGEVALAPETAGGTWSSDCGACLSPDGAFLTGMAGVGIWSISYNIGGECPNSSTGTFEVTPNVSSAFMAPASTCLNASSQALSADVPGGSWSSSCTGCLSTAGSWSPDLAGVGMHEVTYTITGVCGSSTTQEIEVLSLPEAAFTANQSNGCSPLLVEFNAEIADGNACVWQFSGADAPSTETWPCGTATHVFNAPGCYDVVHFVTDGQGCTGSYAATDAVCVAESPESDFVHSPAHPNWTDDLLHLHSVDPDQIGVTFQWSLNQLPTASGPEWNMIPSSADFTPWHICLTAIDTELCESTTCTLLEPGTGLTVYAPNAFTPDEDGRNDAWRLVVTGEISELELTVFDRWGQRVFYTTQLEHWWDGRVMDGNHYAPNDVYLWRALVRNERGDARRLNGHVTLIR